MLGDLKSREHILPLFDQKMRILRRAARLADHGYLYRLSGRRAYEEACYGIGNQGAKLVEARYGISATSVNWHQKHEERSEGFRRHEHLNARMVITIMKAAQRSPGCRYISLKEIYDQAPEDRRDRLYTRAHPRRPQESPASLAATVYFDGVWKEVTIRFDWIFGLERAGGRPAYFYLETDRGTMNVYSRDLGDPSLLKKMLVYRALLKRVSKKSPTLNERIFGAPLIRPLFLITARNPNYAGTDRMQHAIAVLKELTPEGDPNFLFTDRTFFDHGDPLTAPIVNGRGERLCLLDLLG